MRNDARPIGEAFRDIAGHECREGRSVLRRAARPPNNSRGGNKPFVTNRDPGDEELPFDMSDR